MNMNMMLLRGVWGPRRLESHARLEVATHVRGVVAAEVPFVANTAFVWRRAVVLPTDHEACVLDVLELSGDGFSSGWREVVNRRGGAAAWREEGERVVGEAGDADERDASDQNLQGEPSARGAL